MCKSEEALEETQVTDVPKKVLETRRRPKTLKPEP